MEPLFLSRYVHHQKKNSAAIRRSASAIAYLVV